MSRITPRSFRTTKQFFAKTLHGTIQAMMKDQKHHEQQHYNSYSVQSLTKQQILQKLTKSAHKQGMFALHAGMHAHKKNKKKNCNKYKFESMQYNACILH